MGHDAAARLKEREGVICRLFANMPVKSLLTQNMRAAADPQYAAIQDRVRAACVTDTDLRLLNQRRVESLDDDRVAAVLAHPEAILISETNEAVDALNQMRTILLAAAFNERLCVFKALDYPTEAGRRGRPPRHAQRRPLPLDVARDLVAMPVATAAKRPPFLGLFPGMQVALTDNAAVCRCGGVALGCANGVAGTVLKFETDDEPVKTSGTTEYYAKPASAVFIELNDKSRHNQIIADGMPGGVVCVKPTAGTIEYNQLQRYNVDVDPSLNIHRYQMALVPYYALTCYKAQGQTLPVVVAMIGRRSNYVALSRVSRLQDITFVYNQALTADIINCYVSQNVYDYIVERLLSPNVNVQIANLAAHLMDDPQLAVPVPLPLPPVVRNSRRRA